MDRELNRDVKSRIRYAVVGLGHIAQAAVLPAFKHASENSELAALISGDEVKRKKLGKKYRATHLCGYEDYDRFLQSGEVDAVYLALPNHLHCDYTIRAAAAGVHVLCEKPMAITVDECRRMIEAADRHYIRLMIAYRLHFEEANLKAIEIVKSGEIGEPRFFTSSFSMQAKAGGIRLRRETGGGTLYDIGIYCLQAARCLFGDEPLDVFCRTASGDDARFAEVDEMACAVLRFPGDRLAQFTSSFGAADTSSYRVVGTKGDLVVEPAYEYQGKLGHRLTIEGKGRKKSFGKRDQFAPELIHFSECVLQGREPGPSGATGLADVRIIEALYESAAKGHPVSIDAAQQPVVPSLEQEIRRSAVSEPELVHAEAPHE